MVPNSEWILDKMNGLYGLKSWTIERITRIKTDQTILSLLVGSMGRAVAFYGDEVRPVHLPPKRRGGHSAATRWTRPALSGRFWGVDESDLMDSGRMNWAEKTKRMKSGTYCEGRSSVALRCA